MIAAILVVDDEQTFRDIAMPDLDGFDRVSLSADVLNTLDAQS